MAQVFGEAKGSWLCPEPGDRARLIDMDRRIAPMRRSTMFILGAALIVSAHWVGWWTVVPLAMAMLGFGAVSRRITVSEQPEWRVAGAWIFSELCIAGSVALSGGPDSPAVGWLAIPAVTLPARFGPRGIFAGVAIAAGLMLLVTVGVDPASVADRPQELMCPLALLGATAALTMALHDAEREHRSASVIDQLTGLLNRNAMQARVVEIAMQSEITGQPVGVIVADLDHFKAVNDRHGHATGDAVLREVAYRMRRELRAYDLAYRLGGEEFVVIVPGGDEQLTVEVAERLRRAIAAAPLSGVELTMSFGVAVSDAGRFDFDTVFERADAALYDAKARGRDHVAV